MQESPEQRLGQNINKLRQQSGLTQEKLAENAEMSRRYLQEIEAGKKCPTLLLAGRIKCSLGCTWDELMEGVQD